MSNIWLITQREYITRVKSKTFLLTTFITPIGFLLFFGLVAFIMSRGSDNQRNIVISDPSGLLAGDLKLRDNISYEFSSSDLETLKQSYADGNSDGVLYVPPVINDSISNYDVVFYSDERLGLDEIRSIESGIDKKMRAYKVAALNLDEEKIAMLRTDVDIDLQSVKDTEKEISTESTKIGAIMGIGIAYIMFFLIFLYGAQVMRSVMEEKINRIVEVLISSVKPFDLMMGKILGVGAVGLTQIIAWMIILLVGFLVAGSVLGFGGDMPDVSQVPGMDQAELASVMSEQQKLVNSTMTEIGKLNWWVILPLLIFYFLTGYLAYAALFAAVGSAVGEDINEAQSLTLPIMMPLMLAFYMGFSAMNAPNGSIGVWGSIIPLTSSIVMPVRLPVEPPVWQILLSVVLLIAFVLAMVWLAAKIYRVGILMYGKKASFKELGKWIFYK